MSKVLVFNPYYYKENLGDQLFILAFQKIFPDLEFTFVNNINLEELSKFQIVFFGGGSFLEGKSRFSPKVIKALKTKKLFYIGVGTETSIDPVHQELMAEAQFVASRSIPNEFLKKLNSDVFYIPDLVYSLHQCVDAIKIPNRVLILPNYAVVPSHAEPAWKHAAWNYFKSEFTQFLDYLVTNQYEIDLAPMCKNSLINDNWALAELIGQMVHRNHYQVELAPDLDELLNQLSQYQVVITQRYHGSILSQMARVPHLTIHHHDKLKADYLNEGIYISYYGVIKQNLIDCFHKLESTGLNSNLGIDGRVWVNLREKTYKLLD